MRPQTKFVSLLAVFMCCIAPRLAEAKPGGYSFIEIAKLGDAAPGGATFINDFEPAMINNRGDVTFGADLSAPSPGNEGNFLVHDGHISALALPGQEAPGGLTYDFSILSPPVAALNQDGDVGFDFDLEPFNPNQPRGFNQGIFRFSHGTGTTTAVYVPGVTGAPGGGTFVGSNLHPSINNRGDLAFTGMVTGADIDPDTPPGFGGMGLGVFLQHRDGTIVKVVRPGDPAPGAHIFDFAESPWINSAGDIGFGAHVEGEECLDFGISQQVRIFCGENVYVKHAASGLIESIAHQGEPAPGGGTYRYAFGPILNSRGDIVFIGDLTPAPDANLDMGVFLHHAGGATVPVVRPGDPVPGGGHFLTAAFFIASYYINDAGDVSFLGALDSKHGSLQDTALFVLSHGQVRLVARTGTVIPNLGTIADLNNPFNVGFPPASNVFDSAVMNDRGQILFEAIMTDGSVLLIVATPTP